MADEAERTSVVWVGGASEGRCLEASALVPPGVRCVRVDSVGEVLARSPHEDLALVLLEVSGPWEEARADARVLAEALRPRATPLLLLLRTPDAASTREALLLGAVECLPGGLEPDVLRDRKSTRLNSSHSGESRMPSSA